MVCVIIVVNYDRLKSLSRSTCSRCILYRRWRRPSASRTLRDDGDVAAATTTPAARRAGPAARAGRSAGGRRRTTAKTPVCRGARTTRTRVCSGAAADGAARWWSNTGTAAVPTDAPPWRAGACMTFKRYTGRTTVQGTRRRRCRGGQTEWSIRVTRRAHCAYDDTDASAVRSTRDRTDVLPDKTTRTAASERTTTTTIDVEATAVHGATDTHTYVRRRRIRTTRRARRRRPRRLRRPSRSAHVHAAAPEVARKPYIACTRRNWSAEERSGTNMYIQPREGLIIIIVVGRRCFYLFFSFFFFSFRFVIRILTNYRGRARAAVTVRPLIQQPLHSRCVRMSYHK